jgi:hypothetical protein
MSEPAVDPVDELAARLPRFAPSADRADAVRHAIMAATGGSTQRRPRRPLVIVAVVVAAAAAIALAYRPGGHTIALTPRHRGLILASDRAAFERTGLPGRETVTLHDGVMRFEVDPLGPGERFHVLVGDHRVEVRGTIFHVTARHDRLLSVSVARGHVDVFGPTGRLASLAVGDSWQADVAPTPTPAPADAPTTGGSTAGDDDTRPDHPRLDRAQRRIEVNSRKYAATRQPAAGELQRCRSDRR